MLRRVVLKLSGEVLAGDGDSPFDDQVIDKVAKEIKEVLASGTEVSLVVGGGNFWRGRDTKDGMDRVRSDQIGMMATVMNGIYLTDIFRLNGVASVVMTPFPVGAFTTVFSRESAMGYMARGYVLINAAGTGHPYLSTDTIAALRAAEIGADCILYAKNIDGVYDKNPSVYPDARRYKAVSYEKIVQSNLEAADIAAMNIAREARVDSLLFQMDQPANIIKACNGNESIGTKISIQIKEEYYE